MRLLFLLVSGERIILEAIPCLPIKTGEAQETQRHKSDFHFCVFVFLVPLSIKCGETPRLENILYTRTLSADNAPASEQ
jgi:hypothetical protein